jgi:hypothetical protein
MPVDVQKEECQADLEVAQLENVHDEPEGQGAHVEVRAARPEVGQVGWLMLQVVYVTAQGALVRK